MIPQWTEDLKPTGEKPSSSLAQIICENHPYGIVDALVFGQRGIGKSVYALKVAEQIFQYYGANEAEAWKLAMRSLKFTIQDFIRLAKDMTERDWITPVVIIDDAGSGFGSKQFFQNRSRVNKLKSVLDTARTWSSAFIFTTPTGGSLLKDIRRSHDFEIKIVKEGGWERLAKGIKMSPGYGGITLHSKRRGCLDKFSARLPNWKYNEYAKKRRRFAKIDIAQLDKSLQPKAGKA